MLKILFLLTICLLANGEMKEKGGKMEKREAWGRTWCQPFPPQKNSRATPYFWDFEADSAFERVPYYPLTWQWGVPTSGPGSAYSGTKCWATNLSGDYENNCDWKLTMPPQNFTSAINPQLQFYHWYSTETSYDSGWVEASTNGGSSWTKISDSYRGSSNDWIQAKVSLAAYAGMNNILIRFRFKSDGSVTYPGWYIDDVKIIDVNLTTHLYQQSFEGTDGDLGEVVIGDSSAPWQRGVPSSGPGSAYDGIECWATNLAGNYKNNADAAIRNGTNLNLQSASYGEISFYQWYSTETGYDSGWVEVSTNGANGPWAKVSPSYRGASGGWLKTLVDISSYTNTNKFRFRFRFKSDVSITYEGWYIDSVRVSIGSTNTLSFYDFEANNGDFVEDPSSSDINEWHCGTPTSGPNGAYSGTKCWATDLTGDYENNANWELMTPICDLSGFTVASLQLAQWFSTESDIDFCIIEISSDGGANWTTLRTYSGNSNGWLIDTLDITPYTSTNFRAKFRFTSNATNVAPGWYIDDVRLDTVGGYIPQDPIKVATNWIALYVSNDPTNDPGTYTCATEPAHRYGADITLLYGGGAHNPWSSYNTIRSEMTHTDYVTRSPGVYTSPPYDTFSLVRAYKGAKFTDATTLLQNWRVVNGQDDFEIRQRFRAQLWNDSSGLEISLILINRANQSRTFSFRYEWDTHVDALDSPYFRKYYSLFPNPWEPRETQWGNVSSLWFGEEAVDNFSTKYHYLSVTLPAIYDPDPTCPDSLFYVRFGGDYGGYMNAFDVPYMGDGVADSLPGYYDDCVCYMWVNRQVGPNDSIVLTQYLFSHNSPYIGIGEESGILTYNRVGLHCSNPIRKGSKFIISSSSNEEITVTMYAVNGRKLKTIYKGKMESGSVNITFDGLDDAGREVPNGIYFIVATDKGSNTTKKVVYLK